LEAFKDKYLCSGCTACMNSCPANAISMVADSEGFNYPIIDDTKCIECGICQKVCPFHNAYDTEDNFEIPLAYAVKHKDDSIRISSSSGGMFTALSNYILNKNGVIYGVAFDDDFRVSHQKAETTSERDKFKGSKYVQSSLGDIFLDLKIELEKGKYVLFTGTPCQTAGLKAYLRNKKYNKLIVCDLVCLGTFSPLIWYDYKSLLVKKKKAHLQYINFRDKTNGWHKSRTRIYFENGLTIYNSPLVEIFDSLFFQHMALRPSCHACVFKNLNRPSDITMADFWGIERINPVFDDNKGISLVLINTQKGEAIFENIKENLLYLSSNINECRQRTLMQADAEPPQRNIFWQDYYCHGFEYVAKKYTSYGLINKIKRNVLKPLLSNLGLLHLFK
jgi:coenzyme F420-reducing hydrogenase beta subunit